MLSRLTMWLRDWWSGRPTSGDRGFGRSPHWPAIRKNHLRTSPACRWCGGRTSIEVHHVVPFHVDKFRELDESNLITLCNARGRFCHFRHGHFGDWKKWNPDIVKQCERRKETNEV